MSYRNLFKKAYNINFGKGYEIHHIDLDRTNNSIQNLMILPTWLHREYHNVLQEMRQLIRGNNILLDIRIGYQSLGYERSMLNKYYEVMAKMEPYIMFMKHLQTGRMFPDVYNIAEEIERSLGEYNG